MKRHRERLTSSPILPNVTPHVVLTCGRDLGYNRYGTQNVQNPECTEPRIGGLSDDYVASYSGPAVGPRRPLVHSPAPDDPGLDASPGRSEGSHDRTRTWTTSHPWSGPLAPRHDFPQAPLKPTGPRVQSRFLSLIKQCGGCFLLVLRLPSDQSYDVSQDDSSDQVTEEASQYPPLSSSVVCRRTFAVSRAGVPSTFAFVTVWKAEYGTHPHTNRSCQRGFPGNQACTPGNYPAERTSPAVGHQIADLHPHSCPGT